MSNNPPFDLGFVHGTFRFVLENSVVLGVDVDLRPQWQHVLDNLTPYSRSVDEYGRSVVRTKHTQHDAAAIAMAVAFRSSTIHWMVLAMLLVPFS